MSESEKRLCPPCKWRFVNISTPLVIENMKAVWTVPPLHIVVSRHAGGHQTQPWSFEDDLRLWSSAHLPRVRLQAESRPVLDFLRDGGGEHWDPGEDKFT